MSDLDDGRFRELFEAIDEGYCLCEIIVDEAGAPIDYRFLDTNPLFEEMTGLHDAAGRTALELVPELEPHWVATYARAAIGRERLRFELGSDAMGRWFDVFTMPIGESGMFGIIFKDETKRHQGELDLRASEQRYRRLAEQEHRVSLRFQRALLPDAVVDVPTLEITALYEASETALEVGGDWYDTFRWPDGQVGVMVGDVVGHDVEAAVAMGRLRAGVAALAGISGPSPAALLRALDVCARSSQPVNYVTACALVIDPATGRVTAASAGHPPALVVTPSGQTVWLDSEPSPPIGIIPLDLIDERTITLESGSAVIVYSDGLVERRSQPIDDGLERLKVEATALVGRGSSDLARDLAERMRRHSPTGDDVVALCLQYDTSR